MQSIPVRHINRHIKEPHTTGEFIIWPLDALLHGNSLVQPLHRHSFYFMLVIEKGRCDHTIDFIPYTTTNGAVYIMRPGQVHELKLSPDCQGYLVQFTEAFCLNHDIQTKEILKKISRKNHYDPDPVALRKMMTLMDAMQQENTERKEGYEYAIQSNLRLFFLELLRNLRSVSSVTGEKNVYQIERLDELRELIAGNAVSHKPVSWYAEKMSFSSYQLNALVKKTLGKSCQDLINDFLLLEAKRYLLATGNQVNQICWHLGYEDPSYFIRFFKKHTGYSPEAFRNHFK